MRISTCYLAVFTALLLFSNRTGAQNVIMGSAPSVSTCNGFFVDSGVNGNYGPNLNQTMTICPSDPSDYIQLVFSNSDIGVGDNLCFYDGQNTGAPLLACSEDFLGAQSYTIQATVANPSGCLTMTFTSDASMQGAGWSADINCIQACQTIYAELITTDPAVFPADTGWIDICPGDRVFFESTGLYPQNGIDYNQSDLTSTFEWNFGDGQSAVGPNASHVFEESGGYTVQLTITDVEGCTNINYTGQRVRVSTHPDFMINEDLLSEICAGDTVHLSASVNAMDMADVVSVMPVEGSFPSGAIVSDSLPLPDGIGQPHQSTVTFNNFSPGQTLTNVNDLIGICVIMEHSWMHDLEILLTCPDGTEIILHNYVPTNTQGAGETFLGIPYEADDFNTPNPPGQGVGWEYCWTPTATNGTWREYATNNQPGTLPAGNYESYDPLSDLIGCTLNGDWTITVWDRWGSDNGWIFEWRIDFVQDLYPDLEAFTPQITDFSWQDNPTIYYYQPDSISAAPQNAGTASYTFSVEDEFGCAYDTVVAISILPFTHPNCHNCAENITPQNDTIICQGETVSFDISNPDALQTEAVFESIPLAPFGAGNHPPSNPFESSIQVNSVAPNTLTNPQDQIESVCINIENNWNSDINVWLQSPSGQLLELTSGNGGGSDNYTNTCFTPSATTPIISGTGPFTGEFSPEGNWNALTGATINGSWTLLATDAFAINDVGEITSWSITFNSQNTITYSWTGAGLSCNNCPDPNATPALTTNYQVSSMDSYGCSSTDQILVEVVNNIPAPVVNCISDESSSSVVFSWDQVGSFTEYEVNVIINGAASGWQGPINGTTYSVNSLLNGDEVELLVRVIAQNLNCNIGEGSGLCTYDFCNLSGSLVGNTQDVSCHSLSDGSVSVQAANGSVPYQYFLDGSNDGQVNGNFSGLSAGNHFVVVSDVVGCADTIPFFINEPDTLLVSINSLMGILCYDGTTGSLQAFPSGGTLPYDYTWNTTPVAVSDVLSDIGAGVYAVTVTDSEGCTATASFELSEPELIQIELTATDASCNNSNDGQVSLLASGGTGMLTYAWSNGGTGTQVTGLSPDAYCVSATDANGCMAANCIDVNSPNGLVIESIDVAEPSCFGESNGFATVTVSGGTGTYTYLWDDPLSQIDETAALLAAGSYSVTITDGNGCEIVTPVAVNQPEQLGINFNLTEASCVGLDDGAAQAVVVGGIMPYQYAWPDGQNTETATGLLAGNYGLSVTDANGCIAEAIANVEEPDEPVTLSLSQTFRGCFGQMDNEATVIATGGTGTNYTYLWSNGQSLATATGLDSILYSVSAMDENGCEASGEILLQDLDEVDFLILEEAPSCNGLEDGRLGVIALSGGVGQTEDDYLIQWSTNETGNTITGLVGGATYSVTVTDAQGCQRVKSRFLEEPEAITFSLSTTPVSCNGGNDGVVSVTDISGPNDDYTFEWSTGQTDESADNLSVGIYFVTVTDNLGCIAFSSIELTEPTALTYVADVSDNDCFGSKEGAIAIVANGGTPQYSYAWSNGAQASEIGNLSAGVYDLTLVDANGCVLEAAVEVAQPEALIADLETQDPSCFGKKDGSISIFSDGGTPPYRYSLDNQFFNGSSMQIALSAGAYTVYIMDGNGCIFAEEAELFDPAPFVVDAGPESITLVLGDSVTLSASAMSGQGEIDFTWEAPYVGTLSCVKCLTTTSLPDYSILYTLHARDANGCEASDQIWVYVDKPRIIAVPTGFSPNGDNTNEILMVHGKDGENTMVRRFRIFDRWGELVHEDADFMVNDHQHGWNGLFKGQPANAGVYVWYLEVVYKDGMEETLSGHTNLIR